MTVVGSLDTRCPVQLSSDLSCLAFALMLRNPAQILFPQVSSKMALLKANRMWLCPFSFELVDSSFRHFSRISVGASLLFQGFFRRSVFTFCSTGATLMRFRVLNNTLRMDPFFPEFLRGVRYLLRIGLRETVNSKAFPVNECKNSFVVLSIEDSASGN